MEGGQGEKQSCVHVCLRCNLVIVSDVVLGVNDRRTRVGGEESAGESCDPDGKQIMRFGVCTFNSHTLHSFFFYRTGSAILIPLQR